MHQKLNGYSPAADLGRPLAGDVELTILNAYHVLGLYIRETAELMGANHDDIVVVIWKLMLRDMFNAGALRCDVIEAVRQISSEYRGKV
jgi:hypothetical protein